MSGTAVAVRGAQGAAKTGRSGWLASLKDEAVSFLKGDNNAPWAILAETVIGCVPVLGQVVDARDILKGLIEVAGAPASPLAWFNLITALIGLIPGGGDAAKRSLRAVKSGSVHIDELLDMIRRLYKGDPEKLLREVLDVGKLRKYLDDMLGNPNLTKHVSPELRKSIDGIRASLNKQFDAFKKEVDGWLAKGRKTSAGGSPTAKATPGAPAAKPNTTAKAGTKGKGHQADGASSNTPNAASQRTARFKSLTQKVLGVMGEHMADYHCQDVKGWGKKAAHDRGGINDAKLNDGGHMVQLWPCIPRGRGIDAVWKTAGGAKPYAIIEAKASYDPTKSLRALLGEAGDKTEKSTATESRDANAGGAGRAGQRGSSKKSSPLRQTNGMVTQMSYGWIQSRLSKAIGTVLEANVRKRGYTRHVLFFSIPHAVAHAEALIFHASGRPVDQTMHAAHLATREWSDNEISRVVNDKAGISAENRRPR